MQKVSSTHLKQNNKKDRRQVPSKTANSLENKASSSFQESQTPRIVEEEHAGQYSIMLGSKRLGFVFADGDIHLKRDTLTPLPDFGLGFYVFGLKEKWEVTA